MVLRTVTTLPAGTTCSFRVRLTCSAPPCPTGSCQHCLLKLRQWRSLLSVLIAALVSQLQAVFPANLLSCAVVAATGRCHAGPVNIHASVQQAMDRPAQNHRDPWFNPFFSGILEDSKFLFGTTTAQTFIYPGTGTGGWEVGLTNTLSPGDKILTFRYGQFSLLWVDMMERLGLDVQVIDERWGNGVDEARLEKVCMAATMTIVRASCMTLYAWHGGIRSWHAWLFADCFLLLS